MKNEKGITLLSLIITIIIMLILAGVTMSVFSGEGIIKNSQKAVDMAKVEAMREKIQMVIVKEVVKNDGEISIEQIIEQLEKEGIINSGDSNVETGRVKTQPDGYVYEIKESTNGEWEVTYIGTGELTLPEILISLSTNTTGITNQVTITMVAKAESGIASYILPKGTEQSVESGTKEITTTYTATENGTYTFTVTNGNGKTESKSITIDNILEGIIQISANPTTPTTGNVTVTITWPSEASNAIKEVKIGEGSWQTCTGETSTVEVMVNCTIKARIRNSTEDIKTATCDVINIDKTNPTVTAKEETVTITEGDSNDISNYFTIEANGTYGIASTKYIDISNGNAEVTNTNELAVGTHTIKCTVTKETGASASASMTIVVEQAGPPYVSTATSIQNATTEYQDENGNKIVVPGGFKVRTDVTTKVTEGIVIEDGEGNQFVWIPLGDVKKDDGTVVNIELGRYKSIDHGQPELQQSALNDGYKQIVDILSWTEIPTTEGTNRESDFEGINATALNLEKFVTTSLNNEGYYISRYVASFGSGDAITSTPGAGGIFVNEIGVASIITNQKPKFTGETMWDNIRQGDASKACRNLYEGNEYNGQDFVQCDLINSYALDTYLNCKYLLEEFNTVSDPEFTMTTETGSGNTYGDYATTMVCGVRWFQFLYRRFAYDDLANHYAWGCSEGCGFMGVLYVNTP